MQFYARRFEVEDLASSSGLAERGHEVHVFTTGLERNPIRETWEPGRHYPPCRGFCSHAVQDRILFRRVQAFFDRIGGLDIVNSNASAGRRHASERRCVEAEQRVKMSNGRSLPGASLAAESSLFSPPRQGVLPWIRLGTKGSPCTLQAFASFLESLDAADMTRQGSVAVNKRETW
jgi:hypothetical protein